MLEIPVMGFYILNAYGVDGWRVDDLSTKVTQLHCLDIAQLVDSVGCFDDTWISRHKTIHISPYLQHFGIEGCCYDGSCVVATTSS